MAYDTLRTLAFRLAPDLMELPHTFATLSFPDEWKPALREALASREQRNADQVRIPVRSLNQAIRALVPEVISIVPNAGLDGKRPWLYATRPLSSEALFLICHAWVEAEFAALPAMQRVALLEEMSPIHLQWQEQQINLASWTTELNGTAAPLKNDVFDVLPDLLAARLTQEGVTFEFGAELLRFRRAPATPGTSGAELMSWPPLWTSDRRGDWAYSVTIGLTLQTIPFQDYPVVQCDLGLRRWVSVSSRIPGGKTSVYLQTRVPWLEGLPYSSSFQAAPVNWRWTQDGFQLTWASELAPILNALQSVRKFPDPEVLRDNPVPLLRGDDLNAAIVYRNGMTPSHRVQAGLMPGDRHPLVEQVAAYLAPYFQLVPMPKRVKGVNLVADPLGEKAGKEAGAAEARLVAQVAQATGGYLDLEIRYQSSATRDALIVALCNVMGWEVPQPADGPFHWQSPELTCTLKAQPLGAIGAELELSPQIRNSRDRHQRAIEDRARAVAHEIPRVARVAGVLVELASEYKKEQEDPKYALRLGFARTRRLTQFIALSYDEADDLEHRALASVLDLLRQFGVLSTLPQMATWTNRPNVVGLWLIKQFEESSPTGIQSTIPVLILIQNDGHVRAIAPGLADWLSYPELLLAIAQGKATGVRQARQAMPLVRELLEGDVLSLGDTLLLCDAQNIREAWTALNNKNILLDQITLDNMGPKPITTWPGLRVVRLRSGRETPQWYALKEEEYGLAEGVFQVGPRVFASVQGKPPQFAGVSPRLSKIGAWTLRDGSMRDPAPNKHSWNPGLFELTMMALQPGDRPEEWATFVHALRKGAVQYDYATAQPLALHLAKLVKEYAVVLPEDDVEE